MHGTDIVLGEIKIVGPIHGGVAMNTLVMFYADPSDWFFKQFVSQTEFDQYVRDNSLVITKQEKP